MLAVMDYSRVLVCQHTLGRGAGAFFGQRSHTCTPASLRCENGRHGPLPRRPARGRAPARGARSTNARARGRGPEALDDAKRSNEALNEAKTDLELCKLDLEAAQLEIDERAHADQTKVAQLEAQLRDAQTSATEEERTTLRARVEELEAEQRMADELDELHGHEVDALRNDKEQLQEALKKAEADAVELGRAASCLAAERDEREEANSALKARVFDLESDLKSLRETTRT